MEFGLYWWWLLKLLQIWLVDKIDDKEQKMAPQGAVFVPISQFPIKKIRKDCTYLSTPAMKIPETMQNIHACEVTMIMSIVNPLHQIWGGKKREI